MPSKNTQAPVHARNDPQSRIRCNEGWSLRATSTDCRCNARSARVPAKNCGPDTAIGDPAQGPLAAYPEAGSLPARPSTGYHASPALAQWTTGQSQWIGMSDMRFALVNGEREAAQPDLSGACQTCGQAMVARCGEVRLWHWAHRVKRLCDPWWENETEWHRGWKGQFPDAWQEIVHRAETGEKHVADVRTEQGWILEFQHSSISPVERRSRDAFYRQLVWVVDATRRKRDAGQFLTAWQEGSPVGN